MSSKWHTKSRLYTGVKIRWRWIAPLNNQQPWIITFTGSFWSNEARWSTEAPFCDFDCRKRVLYGAAIYWPPGVASATSGTIAWRGNHVDSSGGGREPDGHVTPLPPKTTTTATTTTLRNRWLPVIATAAGAERRHSSGGRWRANFRSVAHACSPLALWCRHSAAATPVEISDTRSA